MDGVQHLELIKHLGLFNGTATLTVSLPPGIKVDDEHEFYVEISDDYIARTLENNFHLIAIPKQDPSTGGGKGERHRTPPSGKDEPGNRKEPDDGAAMPNIKEIHQDDWAQFEMDKDTALVVYATDEGSDYYLNMDNQYMLTELKGIRDQNRIALTKARYKYSMALIGMSVESYYKNNSASNPDVDVASSIRKISSIISPVLIPMVESMADLEVSEIE